ncbi:MAG: electron transfer flavoprotein subunit beta/FixA family protein, partial [Acidimicrobiales bacterium]
MRVAVCAKQIPDPATPGRLDPASWTLDRTDRLMLDEADSYGVEVALRLVERAGGGEVTLVSMAPRSETAGLRTALAMGAASAMLATDGALAGSDALGTAKVLAAAIKSISPDLVLAATESTDGYTGTVPAQLAELLGLPSITFAKRIELDDEATSVLVWRQTEAGDDEVRCPLPALVSVTAGVVEPRYPSYKGIVSAKSKPITLLGIADLGISPASVGTAGAGQEVVGVAVAELRQAGEMIVDGGDA